MHANCNTMRLRFFICGQQNTLFAHLCVIFIECVWERNFCRLIFNQSEMSILTQRNEMKFNFYSHLISFGVPFLAVLFQAWVPFKPAIFKVSKENLLIFVFAAQFQLTFSILEHRFISMGWQACYKLCAHLFSSGWTTHSPNTHHLNGCSTRFFANYSRMLCVHAWEKRWESNKFHIFFFLFVFWLCDSPSMCMCGHWVAHLYVTGIVSFWRNVDIFIVGYQTALCWYIFTMASVWVRMAIV